jgi:hypothetical protein
MQLQNNPLISMMHVPFLANYRYSGTCLIRAHPDQKKSSDYKGFQIRRNDIRKENVNAYEIAT